MKRGIGDLEVSQSDFTVFYSPFSTPPIYCQCQDLLPESNGNSLVAGVQIVEEKSRSAEGPFLILLHVQYIWFPAKIKGDSPPYPKNPLTSLFLMHDSLTLTAHFRCHQAHPVSV